MTNVLAMSISHKLMGTIRIDELVNSGTPFNLYQMDMPSTFAMQSSMPRRDFRGGIVQATSPSGEDRVA